ncbi:nucleoside hydrolase [Bifidobacterium biavatii]|uniref:Inosine/uridine-preferring nucleoside hydrolase n=1 Tax=Bifidobacterium biavatii DSM 23969 TaxID=1437608 RepID=A0A086ZR24_9BIFI|nr:nucleoside hydrolase [Bifidobacterium biavatii]KFI48974.1 inosine/uridine-preferring nucleoside hydrolase [Bifidobacterium biavatii DSM 23969]
MTRLVLDVDTGIDDTLALCYLLASPEAELMGVVGTYGNVTARDSVRNNHAVLRLFGREDIPVMLGCEAPSWSDLFEVDEGCARFHGSNGLGNVDPKDYLTDDDVAAVGASRGNTDATHDAALADTIDVTDAGDDLASSARPSVAAFRTRLTKSVGGERVDVETTAESAALADAAAASREGAGVRFIVDAVRAYGRDVTIVATGPLTDVDAAIRFAPDIVPNLRLVIMGGSLTQEGNCYDLICETNIFQDPEAANRVFRSGADVTMIGLDVTHQCLMTRADADLWRATGTRRGAFLADMVRFYINANEASDPIFLAGSPLHDPLAAAVALDRALVGLFDVNMMTETATGNGHGFRGRTIGDPTRLRESRKTSHVALTVDAPCFTARFRDRLAGLCAA